MMRSTRMSWTIVCLMLVAVPGSSLAARLILSDSPLVIPGVYHVLMRNATGASASLHQLHRKLMSRSDVQVTSAVDLEDTEAFLGLQDEVAYITAELSSEALGLTMTWPDVELVESVRRVTLQCAQQNDSDWSLQRVSGRESASAEYTYSGNGTDVIIYVIDTGVYLNHSEFGGRAEFGTCIPPSAQPREDLNGHGTHVAGLAAGATYGAAKAAKVVSVRMFDDQHDGTTTNFLDAVRWVLADHLRRALELNPGLLTWQHKIIYQPSNYNRTRTVVNISVSDDGFLHSLVVLIRKLKDLGAVVVTAAGNYASSACKYSPSVSPDTITVACSDASDTLCSFSNYGSCVDFIAPGDAVMSAATSSINAFRHESGTSMSAPLVSGLVASYMSSLSYVPHTEQVREWLYNSSTQNRVLVPRDGADTPNLLVFSGCGGASLNHSYPQLNDTLFDGATCSAGSISFVLLVLTLALHV